MGIFTHLRGHRTQQYMHSLEFNSKVKFPDDSDYSDHSKVRKRKGGFTWGDYPTYSALRTV